MSRKILIDGENLSYAIRNFLGSEVEGKKQLAPRSVLLDIDYKNLINSVLGDDVAGHMLFYGVRMRLVTINQEMQDKTRQSIERHARLVNILQKQGISFVKVGNLRPREKDPCENCGHSKWSLVEKGVDVGLAIRLVMEAEPGKEIVLVSSDTDLLPAVKLAREKGAKVIFIGYEYQPVLALAKAATLTRLITAPMVSANYSTEAQGKLL